MAAAQTFSVNVVGYVNVTVPAGFSMVANPLNNTEGNTLDNLMPNMGIGSTAFKWNGSTFDSSTFIASWTPDLTLEPGEGIFLNVGEETNLTFVGEVMQGTLSVELPAGLSIASNMVPAEESLDTTSFPAELGDTIFFFRNGTYEASTFIATFTPEAVPRVGEAFWVNKATAGTWTREFTVPE